MLQLSIEISCSISIDNNKVRVVRNRRHTLKEIRAIELIKLRIGSFATDNQVRGLILIDYPTSEESPFVFVDVEKGYHQQLEQIILSAIKEVKAQR